MEHTTLWAKDRIKEHFIKRFSAQLDGLGSYKKCLKKGGRGPLGPSPNSAYERHKGCYCSLVFSNSRA